MEERGEARQGKARDSRVWGEGAYIDVNRKCAAGEDDDEEGEREEGE